MGIGIDNDEDLNHAENLLVELQTAGDSVPGWLINSSGLEDVITALEEAIDEFLKAKGKNDD